MLNDTGLSGSELRLQTVRERELEQQLKQSAQREKQLQDELSVLKSCNNRLKQSETSLKQRLQESQKEVKQRDDLIKKIECDRKDCRKTVKKWITLP